MSSRRLPLPSIEFVLFLALFTIFVAPSSLSSLLNVDGDTAYHISLGREIIRLGALPESDPLSFVTSSGFIAPAWGSALIFSIVDWFGGLTAVAILGVTLFSLTFTVLFTELRRSNLGRVETILLIAAALYVARSHFAIRPHLFGWLALVLLFALLKKIELAEIGKKTGRGLMLLLFCFWANLHGSFLVGLLVVLCWSLPRLLRVGMRDGVLIGVAILGSLCTPYGINLPLHIVRFMLQSSPELPIVEWLDPSLFDSVTLIALATAAWVLVRLSLMQQELRTGSFLIVGPAILLALTSARMLPIAMLILLGGLILASQKLGELKGEGSVAPSALGWAVLALGVSLVTYRIGGIQIDYDPELFPVELCDTVASLPERLFVDYNLSSYVAFRLVPKSRVFLHSGSDQSAPEKLAEYSRALADPDFASKLFEEYQIGLVILPSNAALMHSLRSRGWQIREFGQFASATRSLPTNPTP